MKPIFSCFLIVSFFYSTVAIGQIKNEKEERIKFTELPETIRKIITELPSKTKRLKFYKETDNEKHSFEIKLKYKGSNYSIEFSELGVIEDIEILSKFKTINKASKTVITSYFNTSFSKYKLIKTQKQHVFKDSINPIDFVKKTLSNQTNTPDNFEIIAEVKIENKKEIREFTFNHAGVFQNFRIVNPLSYDYVLY